VIHAHEDNDNKETEQDTADYLQRDDSDNPAYEIRESRPE
jgi:hypothetical protein